MVRSQQAQEDREALIAGFKADFDARLARMAADPAEWVTFIEQVAVFGARYTLHNQWALLSQCEKRQVTPQFFLPFGNKEGTSGWKAAGRSVRKGEKAFYVWAPVKRRQRQEEAELWKAQGRTVKYDPDGRPTIQVVAFTLSPTFELSQTDGEPFEIPTVQRARRVKTAGGVMAQLLQGDDPTGAYDDIVKLIKDTGYSYELAPPGSAYLRTANGVTVTGAGVRRVLVRDDLSPAQRTKTSVHELAHIRCEHCSGVRLGEDLHKGRKETEAESVAHLVCRVLGLDSRAYSDAYVLDWAKGDMALVQQCAQTILRVAKAILADLTPPDVEAGHTTAGS
jgi:hypothetical protein